MADAFSYIVPITKNKCGNLSDSTTIDPLHLRRPSCLNRQFYLNVKCFLIHVSPHPNDSTLTFQKKNHQPLSLPKNLNSLKNQHPSPTKKNPPKYPCQL